MPDVAEHHVEIIVLAAIVEAEPKAETVGQRHLLLHGFAGIDRDRPLVLHHVARHEVPAVGGGVEQNIGGTPLDAALQRCLQGFVAGFRSIERQVVAKDDELKRFFAQRREQGGQGLDVLAVDFDEL